MKKWMAMHWMFQEALLCCEDSKESNTIDDVINENEISVITLISDVQAGGLFPELADKSAEKNVLINWMKNKNRANKNIVWTIADGETLEKIKRFHEHQGVVMALLKKERNFYGDWQNCSMTNDVLWRMRERNQ